MPNGLHRSGLSYTAFWGENRTAAPTATNESGRRLFKIAPHDANNSPSTSALIKTTNGEIPTDSQRQPNAIVALKLIETIKRIVKPYQVADPGIQEFLFQYLNRYCTKHSILLVDETFQLGNQRTQETLLFNCLKRMVERNSKHASVSPAPEETSDASLDTFSISDSSVNSLNSLSDVDPFPEDKSTEITPNAHPQGPNPPDPVLGKTVLIEHPYDTESEQPLKKRKVTKEKDREPPLKTAINKGYVQPETDFFLGRPQGFNDHPVNKAFNKLLSQYFQDYCQAKANAESEVIASIIEQIFISLEKPRLVKILRDGKIEVKTYQDFERSVQERWDRQIIKSQIGSR